MEGVEFQDEVEITENSQLTKKPRGAPFTAEEDLALTTAWIKITATGTNQTGNTFWVRTLKEFFKLTPDSAEKGRTVGSIRIRFNNHIKREVQFYYNCLRRAYKCQASGENQLDMVRKANVFYSQARPRAFPFEPCYLLLKDLPLFNYMTPQAPIEILEGEQLPSTEVPHNERSARPELGRDLTKAKAKRKSSGSSSTTSTWESQFRQAADWNAVANTRMETRKATASDNNELLRSMVRVREKELEVQISNQQQTQEMQDDKVMENDLSHMEPGMKEYWLLRQAEVMRRRGIRDTHYF